MRILIAGQKRFGRAVLELLRRRGDDIAAVSCPESEEDSLHIGAMNYRLPVLPSKLTASMVPPGVDLIIAAHCHSFLSAATRSKAELGALGFHPSLLPRHRGRSAVEWAIRMQEPVTGGSLYWMDDTVDGGPIAAQDWCFIPPSISPSELWRDHIMPIGLRLFSQVLSLADQRKIVAEPQEVSIATWEPAIDGVPQLWRPDVPMLGSSRFQVVPREEGGYPWHRAF